MSRYRAHQLAALGRGRSKYNAVKTRLDGFVFDSKREAAVYASLKLLRDAGKIRDLVVHPRLPLYAQRLGNPSVATEIGLYEADFSFSENGTRKWIDVKGLDTPFSKWKRKHVKAQYGIEVEIWR